MDDLLVLYEEASAWTAEKAAQASDRLDAQTPCDDWDVRTLMNHMLETQQYFVNSSRGEEASPPSGEPPELLSDDPAKDFAQAREETIRTFAEPGVIERTGPSLGIAFSDQLLHGWDLAQATGQDTMMPSGLAQATFEMVHGKFTEDQRKGVFKPEVHVSTDASPQDKLLAYTGRSPR